MKIKELKILVAALDDEVEVVLRNHHIEDSPIIRADIKTKLIDKKYQTVLTLHEEPL